MELCTAIPLVDTRDVGYDVSHYRTWADNSTYPAATDRQDFASTQFTRLLWLTVALVTIPLLTGSLNVFLRQFNARVGEGVTYDLRVDLFSYLQRMSLGFFTHTKIGELMSRLNNDVVGAQSAISNTFVNIVTSLIQAVVVAAVMFTLEWRLTLISIAILPLASLRRP